ncbi:MAG TPA: glucokinase, partial [Crenalkalicoccus sp.]|nr:glucokinase [Crenalkalicoccus sp.]
MSAAPTLLADIGGTNIRLSVLDGPAPGPVQQLELDGFDGILPAIAACLTAAGAEGGGRRPGAAVLAVAGPVAEGRA